VHQSASGLKHLTAPRRVQSRVSGVGIRPGVQKISHAKPREMRLNRLSNPSSASRTVLRRTESRLPRKCFSCVADLYCAAPRRVAQPSQTVRRGYREPLHRVRQYRSPQRRPVLARRSAPAAMARTVASLTRALLISAARDTPSRRTFDSYTVGYESSIEHLSCRQWSVKGLGNHRRCRIRRVATTRRALRRVLPDSSSKAR